MLATEDELEHILGANPYASYRTASDVHFPVSLRNELAILERLGEITSSMLAQYPRSIVPPRPHSATTFLQILPL